MTDAQTPSASRRHPASADKRRKGDSGGLANESPALLALVRELARQAAREDLAAALAARQQQSKDQKP